MNTRNRKRNTSRDLEKKIQGYESDFDETDDELIGLLAVLKEKQKAVKIAEEEVSALEKRVMLMEEKDPLTSKRPKLFRPSLEYKDKSFKFKSLVDFPDEILLKIFNYLDFKVLGRCAKVCKRFREVSHDESLWEVVNLYGFQNIPEGFLEQVLANGCKYLNVRKSHISGTFNLINSVSQLECLDIGMGDWCKSVPWKNMWGRVLEDIISSCRYLKKLSLSRQTTFNPQLVANICKNGPTLQVLDLYGYAGRLTFKDIKCIVKNCVELKELNLDNSDWGCDMALLSMQSCSFLSKNLTCKIQKLSLYNQENIHDFHVEALVTRCSQITELNISSENTTNKAISIVVKNLSKTLVKLGIYQLNKEMFEEIKLLKKLKHLSIRRDLSEDEEEELIDWWGDLEWVTGLNQFHRVLGLKNSGISISQKPFHSAAFDIASPYDRDNFRPGKYFWNLSSKRKFQSSIEFVESSGESASDSE